MQISLESVIKSTVWRMKINSIFVTEYIKQWQGNVRLKKLTNEDR